MSAHTCHARGCEKRVPPELLCCAQHWAMVPKTLQNNVYRHYRRGQERTKDPTPAYLEAARAALAAIEAVERRVEAAQARVEDAAEREAIVHESTLPRGENVSGGMRYGVAA